MFAQIQTVQTAENNKNEYINNFTEKDKIYILSFIDFLSQVSFDEIGLNKKQSDSLINELKETIEYEKIKESLSTREYFWNNRKISSKDRFYLKDLVRYLKDALNQIKKGRKDMLITANIRSGKSVIPAIFKVTWGLFSLIKNIVTTWINPIDMGLAPIAIPNSIKNIISGSVEIHNLTKKEYDINSEVVQDAIKYIESRINQIDYMIQEVLKRDSWDDEDLKFQDEMLSQIRIWILEFNKMVRDIADIKEYEKTLLDNYAYFIEMVILDNYRNNGSSSKSAWTYDPILGDWYDPY
ncbi:hypothetical protein [Mycoplasma sp. Z663]|uniref:hypothetical protein n=1 Tax=Mycoplasma sp. Z663 TaxID=3401686 RepID=UPI003AADAF55